MAQRYHKIKYVEEGNYGYSDEKWMYVWYNTVCDIVTFYDNDFNHLLSVNNSHTPTILDAINKYQNSDFEDSEIIKMSKEEIDNLEKQQIINAKIHYEGFKKLKELNNDKED